MLLLSLTVRKSPGRKSFFLVYSGDTQTQPPRRLVTHAGHPVNFGKIEYRDVTPHIAQTLSAKLPAKTPAETPIRQTLSAKLTPDFTLSWSHYVFLMNIDNRDERWFYEIESGQNQWSLSELKQQFNSGINERTRYFRQKDG